MNTENSREESGIWDNTNHVEKPVEGMAFEHFDELFQYYKRYAKAEGFPVKNRTSKKGDDGELQYVTFTCSRAGTFKSRSTNSLKSPPSMKVGYSARINACLDEDGKWRISSVNLEHNHHLSPGKARYFACNCNIGAYAKRRHKINDDAGIRMNKNFGSLVGETGGYESISFLEKDCRNYIRKVRQLQLKEGDAAAVQSFFMKMQAENSEFFYSMDLDDDGRLKNVFWADSRSRAARREFGEVITFDTTYLINKYDMPFAPFVGVNHHGQSILLGCGLISCEDTETFTWLFRTWRACMSNCEPIGIITDQDKAMKKAIEIVFPNSKHRWYLWHIMKKVHEKLRSYKNYESINFFMQKTVYDSQTPLEFEESWKKMVEKHGLHENEWLCGLYIERQHWVPCFVKDNFWAGMSTTQRSESINAFFDGYVNAKTNLKQFVDQYGKALASKVEKENSEDYRCAYKQIPCVTVYGEMEKRAQEVYTLTKFQEFQAELTGKMYCDIKSSKVDGSSLNYCIGEHIAVENSTRKVEFQVSFNKDDCEVRCSCRNFEFRGILCRHAILVLHRNDVFNLPDKYNLTRWRKDVRRSHSRVKVDYNEHNLTEEQSRFDEICKAFTEVANIAADDVESSNYVIKMINDIRQELQQKKKSPHDISKVIEGERHILDPVVTKRKGRPRTKRMESKIGKKGKKQRKKQDNNEVTNFSASVVDQVVRANLTQQSVCAEVDITTHDSRGLYNCDHPSQSSILRNATPDGMFVPESSLQFTDDIAPSRWSEDLDLNQLLFTIQNWTNSSVDHTPHLNSVIDDQRLDECSTMIWTETHNEDSDTLEAAPEAPDQSRRIFRRTRHLDDFA